MSKGPQSFCDATAYMTYIWNRIWFKISVEVRESYRNYYIGHHQLLDCYHASLSSVVWSVKYTVRDRVPIAENNRRREPASENHGSVNVCCVFRHYQCLIEPELLPIEVVHCANRDFLTFFGPVTLTLTRRPSYTNLTHIPGNIPDVQNELLNVKTFESYRLTKTQTDCRQTPSNFQTMLSRGWSKTPQQLFIGSRPSLTTPEPNNNNNNNNNNRWPHSSPLARGKPVTWDITVVSTFAQSYLCLLYTSPSPRDGLLSRMPSSA